MTSGGAGMAVGLISGSEAPKTRNPKRAQKPDLALRFTTFEKKE